MSETAIVAIEVAIEVVVEVVTGVEEVGVEGVEGVVDTKATTTTTTATTTTTTSKKRSYLDKSFCAFTQHTHTKERTTIPK